MYRANVNDEILFSLELNDKVYSVNNQSYAPQITKLNDNTYLVVVLNKPYTVTIDSQDKSSRHFRIYINNRLYTVQLQHISEGKSLDINRPSKASEILRAPMPGIIAEILVKDGDAVLDGQPLLILKAMKMENIIRASHDAIVKKVAVGVNQIIAKDEVLIQF